MPGVRRSPVRQVAALAWRPGVSPDDDCALPLQETGALMDGIDSWLTALGLEQYIEVFRKEEVDLQGLTLLSELDLKDMGLPLGPRKRLLSAIASLHPADHDSSPAEIGSAHV